MEQTYANFIEDIISTRGRNGCVNEYHEQHHIIPKCLGGSNDEENLISLYAKEHFIAHKLLAQENPENEKLVNAFAMMAFTKNPYQERSILSPEEYELARKAFSSTMKDKWKNEDYRNMQIENLHKRWNNPEYRRKQSERRTELNYEMWKDPIFKEKMGKKVKDRLKSLSDEEKQKSKDRMRDISNKLWCDIEYVKRHCSPIFCLETGEYFFKQQDAVHKYNLSASSLSNCLSGKQKSAGKHPDTREPLHWEKVSWETYYENVPDIHTNSEIDLLRSNAS